ncbi:hypothetical protein [Pseudogracilibacillus auburnensis]|uniref:hypothetical protein n=1 Tax=Pseudogracilibacillus auburnensis TaxID=1494959 RepID=UPI001A96621B|nr:hypothetical protein [Pseudogracilibacillus auburnensis]MBO1001151.1 hypothetical protein [Pseudogracilibacillus auburnensis]
MIENVIDIHEHFPVKHEPFREHRKVNPKVLAYQQLLRKKWRENFKFEDEHTETDHPGNEKQSERWQEELKTNRIQKNVFVTGG